MRTALATIGQTAVAVAVAIVVSVVSLIAIAQVGWPAYNSSNQLHALTTVGQFCCLAGLFVTGWLWRRGHRFVAYAAALVFLAAFSVVTLAMPLGATKLYLFGISVDQQFRTEYLTRLADSALLHDMTYIGLPPYYPPGWFWIGGRAAALTGTPAWEMFKPWAVTSIAIAVVVAFVLWRQMIRFEYALIVTTATAATTLAYASTEPYAAMITVLLPPLLVLAWSGLRGAPRSGRMGRGGQRRNVPRHSGAVVHAAVRLQRVHGDCDGADRGRSTTQGQAVGTAAAASGDRGDRRGHRADRLAAVSACRRQGFARRIRYCAALPARRRRTAVVPDAALHAPRGVVHGRHDLAGGARQDLNARRCAGDRRADRLRVVAAVDAGHVGRHDAAVVPAAADAHRAAHRGRRVRVRRRCAGAGTPLRRRLRRAGGTSDLRGRTRRPGKNARRIVVAAGVLGAIGALTFSQDIPDVLRSDIVVAYTDTDGNGQRADRRPPGAETYYAQIDAHIRRVTGKPRDETVVLTADYSFPGVLPVLGISGADVDCANPLAQFDQRSAAIENWSALKSRRRIRRGAGLTAVAAADRVLDAPRRERHVYIAAGSRCLPEPAERAPLSGAARR